MSNQIIYRLLIVTISMNVFASVMASSMLSIAFSDIVRSFNISYETLQWRNILFFSVFAVGLAFFGKLADRIGARKQLLLGLSLFIVASFMSSLTKNWYLFLSFQALQGLADAMIVPTLVIFIRLCFPENKIGWAFGWFSGTLAAATLIGPAIGGILLKYFPWSYIFYLLSGLAVIALIFSSINIPRSISEMSRNKVPLLGGIGLLVTVISLQVLFMDQVDLVVKVCSSILVLLGLASVIFVQFKKSGETAILPTGVFHNRTFILACVRVFCIFTTANAIALYAPSYLRDIHDIPTDQVGWIIMVDSIIGLLLAGIAGKWADSSPRIALTVGILFSLAATITLVFSDRFEYILLFCLIYLLLGMGGTIAMPSQNKIALMSVPTERTGEFMGFFQLIQFGTGAFAAGIFSSFMKDVEPDKISLSGFQSMLLIGAVFQIVAIITIFMDRRPVS
ncbi:Predicted arabinose efflux permease, MFS family [Marininema mesophilum]|uniref:Predicted arabinose efflux permease, MFS family n=1 Tax=Marininema mesophilum TaxID=1048340 RepID=A0A1H3AKQ8_9BACL|nr:MFS transporter [Marininema mesophilum]SDX30031.1 Predicted arabinose efflux permease, MFS family [Marininema mesophilum]